MYSVILVAKHLFSKLGTKFGDRILEANRGRGGGGGGGGGGWILVHGNMV